MSTIQTKERTLPEFRELVEGCDGRLRFEGMCCPPGSALSLLSLVYDKDGE